LKKAPLFLIFFTVFIDLVGFGLIIPLLPMFGEKFGASPFTIGLLIMSYSLMQFFFMPVWGRLSDKVGRRPLLLTSLAASAIGYGIWGFTYSLPMLFLSRLVAGAGNANIAVAQAYIADITTPENRAKGMGLVGAAFGLGFVLGPAIGGLCAIRGYNFVGFVAMGFSLLDLLFTFFMLPEPPARTQAAHERFDMGGNFWSKVLADPRINISLAIFFLSTFAFSCMESTLVLLTERKFHYTPADNGWMFTFVGFVMVLVQGGMVGRLSKKYGERRLIITGAIVSAIGLILIPITGLTLVLYAGLSLLAIGSGINNPSNQSLISKYANSQQVGGVLGLGQSLSTLGRIIGPIVACAAFQYCGMASPYFLAACSLVAAAFMCSRLPAKQ
jgi:MFS transporter, DHA1 family, tetracycline resistance protein